ncbi:response regulator transcription factor [Actinoplanes sp. N902-109]|uniref:response regulator transcription factor n=1 Tax=Actinoplanes sp. (strain N902-109) TaxID=649831 RepID=UPI00032963B7|nr:response regulator [Actinoplanes sp. N902-109]AGL15898.1 two component transcriptional regulator, winged helix family [Actinoplanes sp. N902-109]
MGRTVLLVEDDPDIRHLVSYKLGKGGLDVIAVADGVAALREARAHPPDLVLLDVRMPRLSGIEVCRELRAGPLTATVPIIMLTARSRPQDLEQGYAAGATDYVVKPFSPRELLAKVEAALARVAG